MLLNYLTLIIDFNYLKIVLATNETILVQPYSCSFPSFPCNIYGVERIIKSIFVYEYDRSILYIQFTFVLLVSIIAPIWATAQWKYSKKSLLHVEMSFMYLQWVLFNDVALSNCSSKWNKTTNHNRIRHKFNFPNVKKMMIYLSSNSLVISWLRLCTLHDARKDNLMT